ncbi:MAG: FixH family protein [Myxococcales bacterium]|nr:FixH family protein [Myxococcales bacterium]
MSQPMPSKPSRSLWPYAIIASLVFVAAVQIAFVFVASRNAPVLESETAYADALEYDAVMAARRASAALGWRVVVEAGGDAVTYRVRDAAGAPVPGLRGALSLRARRHPRRRRRAAADRGRARPLPRRAPARPRPGSSG